MPVILLRRWLIPAGNAAGMDANPALLGWGLILFGVFNLVFFTSYYRNVERVGACFLLGCVASFLLVALDSVSSYAVKFVRERLDTMDPAALPEQFGVLAVCGGIYALLTALACRSAERSFEKLDLSA